MLFTSFLTVPAAFGVRAAGFEPVGDVMGCIAFQTSAQYFGRCTMGTPARDAPNAVRTAGGNTQASVVSQLMRSYRTALDRLKTEAQALGADGVLGIDVQLVEHDELREIVAIGTAVRTAGRARPTKLFTTDLSGSDVAALLQGGWTPVELHVTVRASIRHNDFVTLGQANQVRGANVEVSGYSELRQRVTQSVRDRLRSEVVRSGADGALLSDLQVRSWHRSCLGRLNGSDLIGLATATGTSIARFARASSPVPAPLTILPVGKASR